ncbi:hypothetical protein ZWY2020_035932 [Hordeum vulgare]|nr:hypothetical protein ZWY2020_035932 [Hordeum vulgare]
MASTELVDPRPRSLTRRRLDPTRSKPGTPSPTPVVPKPLTGVRAVAIAIDICPVPGRGRTTPARSRSLGLGLSRARTACNHSDQAHLRVGPAWPSRNRLPKDG